MSKYYFQIPCFSSRGDYFSCLIFCKDKNKNLILFFYHSLLPFGGTDLKITMTVVVMKMMMTTDYKEQLFALIMHFGEFCEMYTMASYISTLRGEILYVESDISVYSLTFVHIYIHKSIHSPDHSSLWFVYFHRKAFADCIVLESEFRHVQRQYL